MYTRTGSRPVSGVPALQPVLCKTYLKAKISGKITPFLSTPWFGFSLAVMMLGTYVLDIITPLGVPVWLLYCIPLVLSYWSRPYFAVPTVCFVTILFLVAGFIFSPPGIQTMTALFMRTAFAVTFICFSAVIWMIRRRKRRRELLRINPAPL